MTHTGKNHSYLLPVDATIDKPSTRLESKHLVNIHNLTFVIKKNICTNYLFIIGSKCSANTNRVRSTIGRISLKRER